MVPNPGRALANRGGHLAVRGDPTLLRAVALAWLKTFDEEEVAEKFDITPRAVARILSRPDIQDYLSKRMIPLENIAEVGARRLLEEALKASFDQSIDWKERTENRKLLARTLLPEIKKITVEHRFLQAPPKAGSVEEWARLAAASREGPIVEAEVIEDDE